MIKGSSDIGKILVDYIADTPLGQTIPEVIAQSNMVFTSQSPAKEFINIHIPILPTVPHFYYGVIQINAFTPDVNQRPNSPRLNIIQQRLYDALFSKSFWTAGGDRFIIELNGLMTIEAEPILESHYVNATFDVQMIWHNQ
jgi:hypothetical protein